MANIRFGYINLADAMTLTADPVAVTTAPVTYLQSDARGDIFQATSTASQAIKGTSATAYTISQMCLWRHNLVYSDTIRLQLYSDVAWTTGIYDSTALAAYTSGDFTNWGWGFTNRYFTAVPNVKSFKLTVAASAAALQAARLYLGAYVEAPINALYGFVLSPESSGRKTRSDGGSLRGFSKAKWRSAAFDMLVTTEAYRAIWYEISRYCDIDKSFVASLYPGAGGTSERDHTIYGCFDGKAPAAKISGLNRYDFSMKITEI